LEEKLKELEKEYENTEVPRPENWGGYLAKPYEIEFWQEDLIVFMIGLYIS
jgi:pyridoxamine 5'-phosphate oxidase